MLLAANANDKQARLILIKAFKRLGRDALADLHEAVYRELERGGKPSSVSMLHKPQIPAPLSSQAASIFGDYEIDNLISSARFKAFLTNSVHDVVTNALDEQRRPPIYLRDPRYDFSERKRKESRPPSLEKLFGEAIAFYSRHTHMFFALEKVTLGGLYMEFVSTLAAP